MNDKEKLIKTLKNNLDKGSTSITLDIKYQPQRLFPQISAIF